MHGIAAHDSYVTHGPNNTAGPGWCYGEAGDIGNPTISAACFSTVRNALEYAAPYLWGYSLAEQTASAKPNALTETNNS